MTCESIRDAHRLAQLEKQIDLLRDALTATMPILTGGGVSPFAHRTIREQCQAALEAAKKE